MRELREGGMTEPVSENGWTRRELVKRLKEAEHVLELAEKKVTDSLWAIKDLKRELGTLPVETKSENQTRT